jgi:hypothetical protein
MPGSYPPAAPTIDTNTQLVSIHQFLKSPNRISRRLRTIADSRFVADQILTRRLRTSGGAVLYETGESVYNERDIEAVAPGAEYPRDTPSAPVANLAAVSKWGQAVFLSDEKIKRSVRMGDEVDIALRKVVNTVVRKVDRLTTAAVASAVTATSAAIATWDSVANAQIYRDIELAAAVIVDTNEGFMPDTILMSTNNYALMASDEKIANLRRRETMRNPVYGADIEQIGKYLVISTAVANLPTDDVWIFDRTQLGGMADEADVDPGYATSNNGTQVQTERIARRDGWDLWGRRITVPVVLEPSAAVRITGTVGS